MFRLRTRFAALAVAAAVLLSACAGSTDDSTARADTTTTTTQTASVEVAGFLFGPEDLQIPAGTTVTWTNTDRILHTVTAGTADDPQPEMFDGQLDDAGSTFSFTFDEPGTYEYFCAIHPHMTGTITVVG